MELLKLEQRTEEWLEARKGKITGSKLNDIVVKRGTGKKIGFYELLADKLSIQGEDEDPMDRGTRLEEEALELFAKMISKELDTNIGLCVSDKNKGIALSPDALIKNGKKYTEAVELKCLSSAKHLMAFFEKKIPSEYDMQALQYFIVNEDLQKLYFVFYDPRVTVKPLHYIEINREDVAEDIETYTQYQIDVLKEIDQLLLDIAF